MCFEPREKLCIVREGGQGQGSAVTAYSYQFGQNGNTSNPGDTQTTSQGQAFTTSTNSVTFDNLPQSPNNNRTYVVYAQSSTAISSGSYTLSFSDDGTSSSNAFSAVTPLGNGWYQVGTLTLGSGDPASALTVTLGSVSVLQIALLEQTSSDTYNSDGNLVSETDALGNTTTYAYTALGQAVQQQVTSSTPLLGPLYDKAGNTVSDTDLQNGAITTYSYDAFGDQVSEADPYPDPGSADSRRQQRR